MRWQTSTEGCFEGNLGSQVDWWNLSTSGSREADHNCWRVMAEFQELPLVVGLTPSLVQPAATTSHKEVWEPLKERSEELTHMRSW